MLFIAALIACDSPVEAKTPITPESPATAGTTPSALAQAATPSTIEGRVEENLVAGNYTYTRIRTADGKELWAAAPGTPPAVGQTATVPTGLPMENFHSDSLNRDFSVVYFAETLVAAAAPAAAAAADGQMPNWHPKLEGDEECGPVKADAPADLSAAMAAAAANSGAPVHQVSEVWTRRAELKGTKVSVTGKVVKASSGIMGKTWLHVQDGSGGQGTNDLTVTTLSNASVGDHVVVTGTVSVDQDYGYGYAYPVILTDALVTAAVAGT